MLLILHGFTSGGDLDCKKHLLKADVDPDLEVDRFVIKVHGHHRR